MNDLNTTVTVYDTPEECFEALIARISKTYSEEEIQRVKKAYSIATEAHEGQKRLSGEPYIMHPLNVALILSKLGMDEASVVSAIVLFFIFLISTNSIFACLSCQFYFFSFGPIGILFVFFKMKTILFQALVLLHSING